MPDSSFNAAPKLTFFGRLVVRLLSAYRRRFRRLQAFSTSPPLVILVHGTAASDQHSAGVKWWHTAGPTALAFKSRLAESGIADAEIESFEWSGDNDVPARQNAAIDLGDRITALEREGRRYHLVGHSHGGTVIWDAMCKSLGRSKRLDHLQSWTTIGTPFLRLRPPSLLPRGLAIAIGTILAVTLKVSEWAAVLAAGNSLKTTLGVWAWAYAAIASFSISLFLALLVPFLGWLVIGAKKYVHRKYFRWLTIFLVLTFTTPVWAFYFLFDNTYSVVESVRPDFDQTVWRELASASLTIVPWLVGGFALAGFYCDFLGKVGARILHILSAKREHRAWEYLKGRGLILFAADDEAINGLTVLAGPPFPISLKGMTLKNLIEVAGRIGLGGRSLTCELEDLPKLRTPCVLHWDFQHFVVLKKARGDRIWLHDPAVGIRICLLKEISPNFTGVALELTPTPNFTKKRERNPVKLSSL